MGKLLTFVFISIGIGAVITIWYLVEKKKTKLTILDEARKEIAEINLEVTQIQHALQHNQRIIDTKNY